MSNKYLLGIFIYLGIILSIGDIVMKCDEYYY